MTSEKLQKQVLRTLGLVGLLIFYGLQVQIHAQPEKKTLERVRLTVPAKSLTFLPYYYGKAQGFFAKEGIDLRSSSCARRWV
jgi:ABC-type nitrate/sulfonate/bicarbonate transport system substrate-binding protein